MANPVADLARLQNAIERPLEPGEATAATQWLDDAYGIVCEEIPRAEARMALPTTDPGYLAPERVARVMVAAVTRVLRNPDARRQLGEDTYQETLDSVISSGQLYITAAERQRLTRSPGELSLPGMWIIPTA